MPHVNEANAMSEEMGKGKFFEIVLVSAQARGLKEGRPETRVKVGHHHRLCPAMLLRRRVMVP